MRRKRQAKEYRERKDRWCVVAQKRAHPSKEQARIAGKNLDNRLRIYSCKFCCAWHISDAEKDGPPEE